LKGLPATGPEACVTVPSGDRPKVEGSQSSDGPQRICHRSGRTAAGGWPCGLRSADGVPLRRLLDAGVPVALGTDWVPPFHGLDRLAGAGPLGRRQPRAVGESGLTREEALRMAVQTGHCLIWSEDRAGSLEPGKVADLVVLGQDPLACPLDRLRDLAVEMTIVGGEVVHPAGGAPVILDLLRAAG